MGAAVMINWVHAAPSMLAAFLASFVEFVEALTIVLAVGVVRGWRSALIGVVAGLAVLAILVASLGSLISEVPIKSLQVAIGILLLLFGMRWLRKAILRASGVIPLHDEALAYSDETKKLRNAGKSANHWLDWISAVTTFKAVLLEGLEVVFIVVAVGGAGGLLVPASLGALVAGLIVLVLGLAIHRPLARVPENTLKFAVGILLSTFGIFWLGEGLKLHWPGADLSIPGISIALLASSLWGISLAKARQRSAAMEKVS
jgi:uncharacterized membrane protein